VGSLEGVFALRFSPLMTEDVYLTSVEIYYLKRAITIDAIDSN